jgi:hypothetical protein
MIFPLLVDQSQSASLRKLVRELRRRPNSYEDDETSTPVCHSCSLERLGHTVKCVPIAAQKGLAIGNGKRAATVALPPTSRTRGTYPHDAQLDYFRIADHSSTIVSFH